MSTSTELDVKKIHDLLLVSKPSEASHEASLCPLCEGSQDGGDPHNDDTLGGDVSTYTQDEFDTAVAEAVAPLQAKLDELLQDQTLAQFENRLTEMTEAHEASVAELRAEIDTAVAAAEAAQAERDEILSFLEEAKAADEAAELFEVRKAEVSEAVASLFGEEHIEANLDRWASMEAEAFESLLTDWKAAAEAARKDTADASADVSQDDTPASTAMQHGGTEDSDTNVSDIRRSLYGRGHAVRNVGASYTGGA
jgi:hypothetical protein